MVSTPFWSSVVQPCLTTSQSLMPWCLSVVVAAYLKKCRYSFRKNESLNACLIWIGKSRCDCVNLQKSPCQYCRSGKFVTDPAKIVSLSGQNVNISNRKGTYSCVITSVWMECNQTSSTGRSSTWWLPSCCSTKPLIISWCPLLFRWDWHTHLNKLN